MKNPLPRMPPFFLAVLLSACTSAPMRLRQPAIPEVAASAVRITEHREHDDLLSAGLGLDGLRAAPVPFADALKPTAVELRRRAIQSNWKGIADLGPLGAYGVLYGGVSAIPGREFQAFAQIPGASSPHRVLLQAPDAFDPHARCLLVAPSSGSRGVYGAIAFAGAWGLPRGCAVVYTDKGTGPGYFDTSEQSGAALDGTRARSGEAALEFQPTASSADGGIAVKHAHSRDNPEADWGRHVLQAAQFGLAMLARAYPQQAPFTARNTRIVAVGLSNGGGAVLQAAGLDTDGLLDAVVAMEPNVHVPKSGRALYDYVTEGALYLPCALASASFDATPFARVGGKISPAGLARCAGLRAAGLLAGDTTDLQASAALQHLRSTGWGDPVIATAASTTAFDAWRAVAAAYASAYLRRGVGQMPCGFSYRIQLPVAAPANAESALRAAWWSDANGIPPGAGVTLAGGVDTSADPTLSGLLCLRALWNSDSADMRDLHASVRLLAAQLPRRDLPVWLVHGAEDGLIPTAFSSEPYVDWLREQHRNVRYWKIPHAQHFDAFLGLPQFGDAYVPLLPYGYFVLDQVWASVFSGAALPQLPTPGAQPRGNRMLDASMLAIKP
ncbi:MAG: 3-hydroxybutyrate oligomer hydrolase family protein [Tahibacter sp.]